MSDNVPRIIMSRVTINVRCHAPVTPGGGHGQVCEVERGRVAAVRVYTHSGPIERRVISKYRAKRAIM